MKKKVKVGGPATKPADQKVVAEKLPEIYFTLVPDEGLYKIKAIHVEDGKIIDSWLGTADGAIFLGEKMTRIFRDYIYGELRLPEDIA